MIPGTACGTINTETSVRQRAGAVDHGRLVHLARMLRKNWRSRKTS